MSQTRRAMVVSMTLVLILLTAAMGALLGTVLPYEWDVLLARIQGSQIISIAPASNVQTTLYVLDAGQPARRKVMVDLRLPEQGHGDGSTSVPILLTSEMGTVEIPLDDGLALRMELVPGISDTDEELEPFPAMFSVQAAQR